MKTIKVGEKFGRLTILRETTKEERKNKAGRNYWCRCDCGKEIIVYGHNLKTGNTKSCGCLNSELSSKRNSLNIPIGTKFGLLTVLSREPIYKGKNAVYWKCKCECGKEIIVKGTELRSGRVKNCGSTFHRVKDETGKRYGSLTVLNFVETNNGIARWECQCDCGNIIIVKGSSLRSGHTKSCGCIKSFKEQELIQLLENYNIQYKTQYCFKDLTTEKGGYLRFDFAIFKNSNLFCLIEYQGQQHTDQENKWYSEEYVFRDHLKMQYCQKNNIKVYYCDKNTNLKDFVEELRERIEQ